MSSRPSDLGFSLEEKNRISFLTSRYLEETYGLRVVFTTRQDGRSCGQFLSLNLSFKVGDDRSSVAYNRMELYKSLQIKPERATFCGQVHGSKVAFITEREAGDGAFAEAEKLTGTDGLVTSEQDVFLSVLTADCLPLVLFEPGSGLLGVVHAGFKGLLGGVIKNALEAMSEKGAPSSGIIAMAGPAIGACCYEIGEEKAGAIPSGAREHIKNSLEKKPAFDLKSFCRAELIKSGVEYDNIWICGFCTSCSGELFFSYRRDRGVTGRQAALAGLVRS